MSLILKFPNWQRILYYHNQYNHLPLSRFAAKIEITPAHFNILVKILRLHGICRLVCPDDRSKRMVLTVKGLEVANALHEIKSKL